MFLTTKLLFYKVFFLYFQQNKTLGLSTFHKKVYHVVFTILKTINFFGCSNLIVILCGLFECKQICAGFLSFVIYVLESWDSHKQV